MGNEAFTEAQEKQIVEVIRATVAEVLRQQEAKKQCGDTESQARVAAHIERQRKQLEQIRAEQAAEHDDPIRATVAEVLRQQEAKKQCGDTESQARVAAHIERQRKQLEQIRAEQAAEHGDPIRAMFYRMGAELLGDEITATPARSPASTQAHTPVRTCLRPAALRREAAPSQRPGICSRHNRRQLQRPGAHRKNRNP